MQPEHKSGSGPLVFVDRDGTLIEDRGYLADPAGVVLLPGVVEGMLRLASLSARIVGVTNQSGVARGYFKLSTVEAVNAAVNRQLAAHGVRIDAWYVCPHGPSDGCACRKPRPALVMRACEARGVGSQGCYVIGDKVTDGKLGLAVGGCGILIRSCPSGLRAGPRTSRSGRLVLVRDFPEAADLIARRWGLRSPNASEPLGGRP